MILLLIFGIVGKHFGYHIRTETTECVAEQLCYTFLFLLAICDLEVLVIALLDDIDITWFEKALM